MKLKLVAIKNQETDDFLVEETCELLASSHVLSQGAENDTEVDHEIRIIDIDTTDTDQAVKESLEAAAVVLVPPAQSISINPQTADVALQDDKSTIGLHAVQEAVVEHNKKNGAAIAQSLILPPEMGVIRINDKHVRRFLVAKSNDTEKREDEQ
jgi:hypothetical protein